MNIVIVGHVDHGKSTLIGRMLYETDALPKERIQEIEQICKEMGKEMELAYLLDALEEEREQNITIDITQTKFKTKKREYTIVDAPGHKEFLKNMITGATLAQAAVLIIAADEGLQEQTKRHAFLLSLLGVQDIIVVINKMDKVDYDKQRFEKTKQEILEFLKQFNVHPKKIIPISAAKNDNIISPSQNMQWYSDAILFDTLDNLQEHTQEQTDQAVLPIQATYAVKDQQVPVGRVEQGTLNQKEEIYLLPQNQKATIQELKMWKEELTSASAGKSIGIVLDQNQELSRGTIVSKQELKTASTVKATVFWMEEQAKKGSQFILKCTTQESPCEILEVNHIMNSSTLETIADRKDIQQTEVATVQIKTESPLVLTQHAVVPILGKFVLTKEDNIVAGGIINDESLKLS